eukprot:m.56036 g.56036  ORF g.56036 m.56036 type:complete len:77 (-) comp7647_c0_seq1:1049-1279(-)
METDLVVTVRNASTGQVIPPFTAANCVVYSGDSTRQQVHWQGEDGSVGLGDLAGQAVQFDFTLGGTGHGTLLYCCV